jgi:hypothetical protein
MRRVRPGGRRIPIQRKSVVPVVISAYKNPRLRAAWPASQAKYPRIFPAEKPCRYFGTAARAWKAGDKYETDLSPASITAREHQIRQRAE